MRKRVACVVLCVLFSVVFLPCVWGQSKTIKIGFNLPLTGQIPKVGENSRYAAEMLKAQLDAFGGLKIGDEYSTECYPRFFASVEPQYQP